MAESFTQRLARLRRESSPPSSKTGAANNTEQATIASKTRDVAEEELAPVQGEQAGSASAAPPPKRAAPQPNRVGPQPAAKAGLPDWLRRSMSRKQQTARKRSATTTNSSVETESGSLALHPVTVGSPSKLSMSESELGAVYARSTQCAADHCHGEWLLNELQSIDPADIPLLTGDRGLTDFDLQRAVFLDTETTGLSGGAGVYVYMVGLGTFDAAGGFEVWQSFLPDPGSEAAMLAEVARRVADSSGLVSFFGKSFDRHRLEDKMRIHGIEPPFEGLPHLDLYHPLARLTGGRFPNGRLATMESRLTGLRRKSDLPGALAPAAWFDYLAGRAHRLEGVFQHNLDDVLSLVTLAAYLGRVSEGKRSDGVPLAGPAGPRARALARAHLGCGDRAQAVSYLAQAQADADSPLEERQRICFERAELLRRGKQFDEAEECLRPLLLAEDVVLAIEAAIALAKLQEHGKKELAAALTTCERGSEIAGAHPSARIAAPLLADLERRSERLRARIARRQAD